MKYVVFNLNELSDLELFNIEAELSVKGYIRLENRGDYIIFRR